MFYPCSSLDPAEGIRFRGLSIPEMQERLPKVKNQPIPEAVYWLLLTGEIPTSVELNDLRASLTDQHQIPKSTASLIKLYSKTHHPMTILSMAILDLQNQSLFFNKYQEGLMKKSEYWDSYYEDSIKCLSLLPRIAAMIYTEKYNKQQTKLEHHDWAG